MARETDQSIHPDDVRFVNRRNALKKGLQVFTGAGIGGALLSLGHLKYQEVQAKNIEVELMKAYPEPSQDALAEAKKIIAEHNTYNDLPQRKVNWAQEQLDQKSARDEEITRRFPDGIMPWVKTDKAIGYGGLATAAVCNMVNSVLIRKTQRELTRRDLFRRSFGG